ncbi:MAG: hypothetical protein WB870_13345 [Gallionellaceae bacterium]
MSIFLILASLGHLFLAVDVVLEVGANQERVAIQQIVDQRPEQAAVAMGEMARVYQVREIAQVWLS